jgi:ferric-dicitrate binding protein FerR (iron transport regulator)
MTNDHAYKLIKKYADGRASPQEVQDLMDWYGSSPVSDVPWLSTAPGEKEIVYNRMLQRLRAATKPETKIRSLSWMRVAALLIVIAGIAFMILRSTGGASKSYITVVNPSGKIRQVVLPDSSLVWMNAVSELRYTEKFKQDREVQLKGEAYFDVAHDPGHPFRISAGGVQTTVLGTSFNIKAYETEKETIISVVHGRVQVADSARILGVLTPSMQVAFNRQLKQATTKKFDREGALAWREGKLQFEGASLGDIAGSLERWYGVTIHFTDPAARACRYYMGFDNTLPLTELLSSIAQLTGITYTINSENKTIRLSGKGCN